MDHQGTIYDDAIMDGACPCERVIEPEVTTKADVLELTKAYFTEEAAQRLMNQKGVGVGLCFYPSVLAFLYQKPRKNDS